MTFTQFSLPVLAAAIPSPATWAPDYPDFADSTRKYAVVASGMMPGTELT